MENKKESTRIEAFDSLLEEAGYEHIDNKTQLEVLASTLRKIGYKIKDYETISYDTTKITIMPIRA